MTACSTCADLPAALTAQTGYGESLPGSVERLRSLERDSRAELRECPECGALFVWEDHPQFFGSGNLDEETLERLDAARAEIVHAFLREADPTGRADDLFRSLTRPALELLLCHLRGRRRDVFRALVPRLVSELASVQDPRHGLGHWWLRDLLSGYAGWGAAETDYVLAQAEGRSGPMVEGLVELLRSRRAR